MLDWAQRILAAGEAFSGVECVSLRSMLTAQSSNFFTAYHSANLEALHSMLEKELWRRLPPLPEGDRPPPSPQLLRSLSSGWTSLSFMKVLLVLLLSSQR